MVMGRVLLSRRRALSESADGHGGLDPTENRSQGEGVPQGCIRREGGGGAGTQKCGHQKWPDRIFPIVKFRFLPRWSLWVSHEQRILSSRIPP